MSEEMRLVEMKNIDHVGIAQGFEEHEVIVVIPARTGGDDAMNRSGLPDGGCQLCFYAVPAIGILELGLIDDLEEASLRIPGRIVARDHAPEVGELLDKVIVLGETRLEIRISMHV